MKKTGASSSKDDSEVGEFKKLMETIRTLRESSLVVSKTASHAPDSIIPTLSSQTPKGRVPRRAPIPQWE
jgi:hypothetical protein